jgi:hypothetical protein
MTVNGVLQGAQLVSPDGQYPYQHDYIDACIRVLLAFDYIFRHFHFSNLKIVNFYLEKSSDFEVDFCKNICNSAQSPRNIVFKRPNCRQDRFRLTCSIRPPSLRPLWISTSRIRYTHHLSSYIHIYIKFP